MVIDGDLRVEIEENSRSEWDRGFKIKCFYEDEPYSSERIADPRIILRFLEYTNEAIEAFERFESGSRENWNTDPNSDQNSSYGKFFIEDEAAYFCITLGFYRDYGASFCLENPVQFVTAMHDEITDFLDSRDFDTETIIETKDELLATIADGTTAFEIIRRYKNKNPWQFRMVLKFSGDNLLNNRYTKGYDKIEFKSIDEINEWSYRTTELLPVLNGWEYVSDHHIQAGRIYGGSVGIALKGGRTRREDDLVPYFGYTRDALRSESIRCCVSKFELTDPDRTISAIIEALNS